MARMYTCLLTVCLLLGYLIHLPVTMFPATHEGTGADPRERPEMSGLTNQGWKSRWDSNESIDGFYSNNKNLLARSRLNTNIADQGERIIGSGRDVPSHLNGETNQAESPGHTDFSDRKDLNEIDSALSTTHIKSLQLDINRITQDLMNIKSHRITNQTVNISGNPAKHLHVNVLASDQKTDHSDDTDLRYKPALTRTHRVSDTGDKHDKPIQHSSIHEENQSQTSSETNNDHTHDYSSGILWPSSLINECANGFSRADHNSWKTRLETATVVKMEEGCGNMQNRLVTFNDSTKACVRYRLNTDLMQGDIYSYYLAKLLDMHYIPPTTLHKPDISKQWLGVAEDISSVKWSDDRAIIIAKWIRDLKPVYMPSELKGSARLLHPHNGLFRKTIPDLCGLVQWTDLIVFDYISGNLDRVVNNMFNLKWNERMMERPIHNLEADHRSGRVVFLDNESGLFHGYRLLDTYGPYHKSLLDRVCVFKQSTVDAVERLYKYGNAGEMLQSLYQDNELLHGYLPRIPHKTTNVLQQRIEDVFKHIQLCKHLYSTS